MAYHMLGFGRRIAWEALLAAYQAMIWDAHRLGGTTSELSNYGLGGASLGRHYGTTSGLSSYDLGGASLGQAMIWKAHRLGGTTSGLSSYDLGGASLEGHY